jgi:uncharacterized iron-regulated protein
MKKFISPEIKIALFILLFPIVGNCQTTELWNWYTPVGKTTSFKKIIKACSKADVILFGEYHNNGTAHWLQYKLAQALFQEGSVAIGAEMLETHQQAGIDSFLLGLYTSEELEKAHAMWPNWSTDYAPLADWSRDRKVPLLATNTPRYIAKKVSRQGIQTLDSLSAQEKKWICPLPLSIDTNQMAYQKMKTMGGHGPVSVDHMIQAQALKDATMAWNIHQYFKPGTRFIHLNGNYHSDNYDGIIPYLIKYRPELKIVSISTWEGNIKELENKQIADFILVVDPKGPHSY